MDVSQGRGVGMENERVVGSKPRASEMGSDGVLLSGPDVSPRARARVLMRCGPDAASSTPERQRGLIITHQVEDVTGPPGRAPPSHQVRFAQNGVALGSIFSGID